MLLTGVKEAGWDPGDSSGTGVHLVMNNSILDATPNNLQHFMLMVVHQVQQQEDAWRRCQITMTSSRSAPGCQEQQRTTHMHVTAGCSLATG